MPVRIPRVHSATKMKDLPAVADGEFAPNWQYPNKEPKNATFVHTASLYRVMDDVLERLQEATDKNPNDLPRNGAAISQLAALAQLDSILLNWFDALPTEMKFALDGVEKEHSESSALSCQRQALKIRFLGMRLLLHRQTILFLHQPVETRTWSEESTSNRPPLFSDQAGDLAGFRHVEKPRCAESPFLLQLAHVSARICVDSAKAQIEALEKYRGIRISGAWWWDFHCRGDHQGQESFCKACTTADFFTVFFNAVCVLIGASGLREDDRTAVLPDQARVDALIRQGVHSIGELATQGGSKLLQSQRFLQGLIVSCFGRSRDLAPSRALAPTDLDTLQQNRLTCHERCGVDPMQCISRDQPSVPFTPANGLIHAESPPIFTTESSLHALNGKDEADWQRNLEEAFPWPVELLGDPSGIGTLDEGSFMFDSIL
jgi:hypothetical protein